MNIHRATVLFSNTDDYSVKISLDEYSNQVLAKPLSITETDIMGAGTYTLPRSGDKCLVIENRNTYWILGYYNDGGTQTPSGFIIDDNYPRVEIGAGDWMHRHLEGNTLHHLANEFRINEGVSAKLNISGGDGNFFDAYFLRYIIDNSAGRLSWKIAEGDPGEDLPSSLEWKINKNFEQDNIAEPSNYTKIRAGSILKENDTYFNHIFDFETIQYENANISVRTYLSLSKDDENNFFKIELEDLLNGASFKYKLIDGYNVVGKITDSARVMDLDILGDNYFSLNFDENFSILIDDSGNINYKTKGNEDKDVAGHYYLKCSNIKFGSGSATEPLVLGNTLKSLLEEFANIMLTIKHLHPMGPTIAPDPGVTAKINIWKNKFQTFLSTKAKTE